MVAQMAGEDDALDVIYAGTFGPYASRSVPSSWSARGCPRSLADRTTIGSTHYLS
jgi:hypothetical protein